MKSNRNSWTPGRCSHCGAEVKVISFKQKKTCRDCLTSYDNTLHVEDFVYTSKNCINLNRGSLLRSGRAGSVPV